MRKFGLLFVASVLLAAVSATAVAQNNQNAQGQQSAQPAKKKGLFGKLSDTVSKAGQKADKAAAAEVRQQTGAVNPVGGALPGAGRDNAGTPAPVGAQSSTQPKFNEGDRVEVDTTHVDVQHGGNPELQSWSKGTVTKVDTTYQRYIIQLDPLPGKLPVMHSIPMYDQECCIRPYGGAAPQVQTEKLRVDENGTVLADRELLDCDNLQHNGRNGSPPPVELAKKLIRCLYEHPSPVGQDGATTMDITDFRIGAPHRWNINEDMGQGNASTLVYPVHVRWNQKTFYRSRNVLVTDKEMMFTCFADTTGLWQCGGAAGPHKDGKQQEIVVKK
jgi:hypothetical protein